MLRSPVVRPIATRLQKERCMILWTADLVTTHVVILCSLPFGVLWKNQHDTSFLVSVLFLWMPHPNPRVIGQFADKPTLGQSCRRLVNARTRLTQNFDRIISPNVIFIKSLLAIWHNPRIIQSMSYPVRDLTYRELVCRRIVQQATAIPRCNDLESDLLTRMCMRHKWRSL